MIAFLRAQSNTLDKLLKHIGCSAISDLILKLISVEELPDGEGTIKWLADEGLIPHLFDQLDPTLLPDIHSNAAQTLMDIISISFQQQPMENNNMMSMDEQQPHQVGNDLMDAMKRYLHRQTLLCIR
jgi:SIT4 phosphatase-associated protein